MTATTDRLRANAKLLGTVAQDLLLLAAALEATKPADPPKPPTGTLPPLPTETKPATPPIETKPPVVPPVVVPPVIVPPVIPPVGAPPPPGPIDTAALLATYDFDAQILFNGAPVASARQMLTDGNYAVETGYTAALMIRLEDLSVARVYDFGGPLRSVHPVFYATFYPATKQVRIRACGPNTNSETLQDVTGDVEILIGHASPQSVLKQAAVPISYCTSWDRVFWIGGPDPNAKVNDTFDLAGLIAKKWLPNWDTSLVIPEAKRAADYAHWLASSRGLYQSGPWMKGMGAPGARWDIGLYPVWCVLWALTGDWRYREICEGMASLAGMWPNQITEGDPARKNFGKFISIHDRPTDVVFGALTTIKLHSPLTIHNGTTYQIAHAPEPFSIPYMLTQDPWYLRLLQNWAACDAMNESVNPTDKQVPYYNTIRRTASPVIAGFSGELRGEAWCMRTRARAGFFSPAGSPEKAYFEDILGDMIAVEEGTKNIPLSIPSKQAAWAYGNTKVPHATKGGAITFALNYGTPLVVADHVLTRDSAEVLFNNGGTDLAAQFQMAFKTGVLGTLEEMGYPVSALLDWYAKFYTRPADEGYPVGSDEWKMIGFYVIPLREGGVVVPAYTTPAYTDAKGIVHPAVDHPAQHGGVGPYFKTLAVSKAAFKPDQFAAVVNGFDTLAGNFSTLAYAASTFITKRPNGDKVYAFLKSAVHDKPRATSQFYLGGETGWDLLPRP